MVNVDFDRDKAAALGLTANQIETALSSAYSSGLISNIYTPTNTYSVILEVKPEFQRNAAALSMLYVRSGELASWCPWRRSSRRPRPWARNP